MNTTTATLPASKKEIKYASEISAGVWIDLQSAKFDQKSTFLIEALVKEFDGSSENILKRIKTELRAADYMFIEKVVMDAVNEENELSTSTTEKKTSQSST